MYGINPKNSEKMCIYCILLKINRQIQIQSQIDIYLYKQDYGSARQLPGRAEGRLLPPPVLRRWGLGAHGRRLSIYLDERQGSEGHRCGPPYLLLCVNLFIPPRPRRRGRWYPWMEPQTDLRLLYQMDAFTVLYRGHFYIFVA